jgi:Protein of unknown function (DUF3164).
MKVIEINGQTCAINADGAYVPLERVREIDKLRDEVVTRLSERAGEIARTLAKFRAEATAEIGAFADLSADQHGVRLRGRKGGFSLMSYDGLLKIVVDNDTLIAVNEKVTVAREAVFACVRRWTEGADANLAEVVRRAFDTDKQGHLSLARLLALRSYRIEGDPEWDAAMEALAQGLTAYGSKTYIRYYRRDAADGKFRQIPVG